MKSAARNMTWFFFFLFVNQRGRWCAVSPCTDVPLVKKKKKRSGIFGKVVRSLAGMRLVALDYLLACPAVVTF